MNSGPQSWQYDRLKDLAQINRRALPATTEPDFEFDYIEISNVNYHGIIDPGAIERLRYEDAPSRARRCVYTGNTIISSVRPNLQAAAFIENGRGDLVCSTGFNVVEPFEWKLHSKYVYYALISEASRQYFEAAAKGVGYPAVDDKDFNSFNIPRPPIPEQKRIAAYLDASCAAIDAAMRAKRRQSNVLEVLAKIIINNAVTNGIRGSHDLEDSGWTLNPNMPRGWHNWRLRTIADIRYGLGQPPAEKGGPIPMIRATNVKAGRIVEDNMMHVDSEHLPPGRQPFLKAGEIIVVRSGAYTGDSSIVPKEYEGAVVGYDMIVSVKRAYPEFIAYALLSSYVLNGQILLLTNRAAQPHLNAHELGGVRIFLPPSTIEQIEISEFLDSKLAELSELSGLISTQIQTLLSYRKSLIHECVTGLRRVTDEDAKLAEAQWPNAKTLRN